MVTLKHFRDMFLPTFFYENLLSFYHSLFNGRSNETNIFINAMKRVAWSEAFARIKCDFDNRDFLIEPWLMFLQKVIILLSCK